MFYTASPTADAERYEDYMEIQAEHAEKMAIEAATQISEAFKTFGPVPYAQYNGRNPKLAYMPFAEAANDMLGYDEVDRLFIAVLKTSECVKVKALLKAMEARFIRMHADELGEVL